MQPMTTNKLLESIAALTSALIGQDGAFDETSRARRALIRQAVSEGHSLTSIGAAAGISRQRVAQLVRQRMFEAEDGGTI